MSMTDPIADMLTRIRNALQAHHSEVDIPSSNIKEGIARVLQDEGYIQKYKVVSDPKQGVLQVVLKYDNEKTPIIAGIQRVSRPGLRRYVKKDQIPKVLNGLGISIISTSRGLMTDRAAREAGVGGEILCNVW